MRWKTLLLVIYGLVLTGCGIHGTQVTRPLSYQPKPLPHVVRQGMIWIRRYTRLPLYAPSAFPLSVRSKAPMGGYGFSTPQGYGLTLVDSLRKSLPFNDPALQTGHVGKTVMAFGVIKPSSPPGLTPLDILASYNLMGPSGIPSIIDTHSGQQIYWSRHGNLFWWHSHQWIFLIEGFTEKQAEAAARPLIQSLKSAALPKGPGLFVMVPGATMADWLQHSLLASIEGASATPGEVLNMVLGFHPITVQRATQNG